MRRLMLTVATVICSIAHLAAQEEQRETFGVWDSDHPESVSLSVGAAPLMLGYYDSLTIGGDFFDDWYMPPFYVEPETYKRRCVSTATYSASYTYRFRRNFSLSCALSYGAERNEYCGFYDDQLRFVVSDDVVLLTPIVRSHWLNTKHLELYSAFGVGVGFAYHRNFECEEGQNKSSFGCSMQLTPIGMSIKIKRAYIFGELGVGTLGTARFGIGYRL